MLYHRWQEVVRQHAGGVALVDAAGGRCWTFRELEQAAIDFVLPAGDIVTPSGNRPDFILSVLAAWREGRVVLPCEGTALPDLPPLAVPVNRSTSSPRPSPPSQMEERVPEGRERRRLSFNGPMRDVAPGREEAFQSVAREKSGEASSCALAHLKLTSGTTGASQLIAFTAGQLAADADHIVATMGLRPDQPNLGVISLAHSYGFSSLVTPLLLHGIPLVLCPSPMPEAVKAAAAGFDSLALPAVPAMWRAWHDGDAIPPNVQLAISAGAPLPLELEAAVFHRSGLKLHNFYGSSECGGIAYDDSTAPRTDAAHAGKPLRGVTLSLADDGCLIVQSKAVGFGYLSAASERLGDGRFLTSDLVELRAGEVFLRGRATDVINIAGRKLSPEIVEAAVRAGPGVKECVVTGIPARDAARGEEVLAIVALSEGGSLDELRQSVSGALASWQCPRHWWVVPEINVSQRGKISRREWRDRFLASVRS